MAPTGKHGWPGCGGRTDRAPGQRRVPPPDKCKAGAERESLLILTPTARFMGAGGGSNVGLRWFVFWLFQPRILA